MTSPFTQRAAGILFTPEGSPWAALGRRLLLVAGLLLGVALLLWLDRDGLRDHAHPDRAMNFADVFYFTVVSLTTVGYGDIVPVSTQARLINAIFLTPVRFLVWAIFLGAALDLVLIRTRESYKMSRLKSRLNRHAIICGFGVKGQSILAEMLAHGHSLEDIVVIEPGPAAVDKAARLGVTALLGDASEESLLRAAAVEKAEHVIVAPHSDDQCVLIALTVRHLNPGVRLIVSAREEENVKLLYRAGADVVVAPSVSGGRLMGAAVRQTAVTTILQDLLNFGKGLQALEMVAGPELAGKTVGQVPALRQALVLGICRGTHRVPIGQVTATPLEAGDIVVYVVDGAVPEEAAG